MLTFDLSDTFSRIRVRGANRVDFLHRMSSGDLLGIQPGAGRTTVFTTPIGRMVDYAIVLAYEDSLLMISGGNGQGKLVRWLLKYIFFNDDVQLTDESPTTRMLGIFGQGASSYADEICEGGGSLGRYAHRAAGDGRLVTVPPLEGAGFYLLGAGQQTATSYAPIAQYQDLRIHAGYPAFPWEIGEHYIPLEAGLREAISFSKGCYIGQEIIARMESRGQLSKRLVKIAAPGQLHPGDNLLVDGNPVGSVTSATSDGHTALGYVRNAVAGEGQLLDVGESNAQVIGLAGM